MKGSTSDLLILTSGAILIGAAIFAVAWFAGLRNLNQRMCQTSNDPSFTAQYCESQR